MMQSTRFVRSAASSSRLVARSVRASTVVGVRCASSGATHISSDRKVKFGLAVAAAASAVALASTEFSEAKAAEVDMAKVRAEIVKVFESDDNLGPFLVRLAWHASGTYSKHTKDGGSGGGATMRFAPESAHGANAGLLKAQALLEPIKAQFPELSYADLWTFAAVTVIEEMGGPKIGWKGGRKDKTEKDCTPDGRLPNADMGTPAGTIKHLRDIFGRMGFSDREIVCLAGAHALGRCHTDRSGFEGPWTRAPTTFSNEYFKLLLNENWTLREWAGPSQWQNESQDLMMLHSDMALIWDKAFLKYTKLYAEDEKLFFADFAKAFQKLEELGVAFPDAKAAASAKPWWQFW